MRSRELEYTAQHERCTRHQPRSARSSLVSFGTLADTRTGEICDPCAY
jgi:hypothetical protein